MTDLYFALSSFQEEGENRVNQVKLVNEVYPFWVEWLKQGSPGNDEGSNAYNCSGSKIFNSPGVAGADLLTPLSIIN